jgi:hypothetical protein
VPKKEFKILGFHGGINDNSDPKDIRDIDFREADGVSTHRIGKLVGIGNQDTALGGLATSDEVAADIEPGYGLYYFSTDYENGEANTPEDWLAIYDKQNSGRMRFYYRDKDGTSPALSSTAVTLGAIKPNFYYADGQLRIGDSSFSQPSKWFGYIDSTLYWNNENASGGSSLANNLQDITKWDNGLQELKDLNTLLGGEIHLEESSAASPDATLVGNGSTKKLILSYWTNEGGDWNGNYIFGVTPIYKGEQEGPISTIYSNYINRVEETVPFYDNEAMFQVFIPMGTGTTVGNETHLLGDSRIIGLNWYFKEQGTDDWIFLMNTDLKEGGKHYWKSYNSTAETLYGHWVGDTTTHNSYDLEQDGIRIWSSASSSNSAIAFYDTVAANGTADGTNWMTDGTLSSYNSNDTYNTNTQGWAYKNVFLRVVLTNNTTTGFADRYGFLKIWGGANSPLYINNAIDASGNTTKIPLLTSGSEDTYYIPLTLPGAGTDREFRVQVLDENFGTIADSGIHTMTIAASGLSEPEDYDQDNYEDRL